MSKVGNNRELNEKELCFSFFEELNGVHNMYRHTLHLIKEIHIKKYSQAEFRQVVDEITMAVANSKAEVPND